MPRRRPGAAGRPHPGTAEFAESHRHAADTIIFSAPLPKIAELPALRLLVRLSNNPTQRTAADLSLLRSRHRRDRESSDLFSEFVIGLVREKFPDFDWEGGP